MEERIVLEGPSLRLLPLDSSHVPALAAAGGDERIWQFTFNLNPFTSQAETEAWLADALAPGARTFVVTDKGSGKVLGSSRFFDIDSNVRKLEIGYTFLHPEHWRTHVNTEMKLLMLQYAFEVWGARRVQFKAEAVNRRSRTAIERLGATLEGVMRKFRMRSNGEIRDTAIFSIVDDEWPAVKARLTGNPAASRMTREAGV